MYQRRQITLIWRKRVPNSEQVYTEYMGRQGGVADAAMQQPDQAQDGAAEGAECGQTVGEMNLAHPGQGAGGRNNQYLTPGGPAVVFLTSV
jgi:hypothetical protein